MSYSHCIIPGAPRSGTTAMFRYLSSHPNVAGSRKKELNFFLRGESLENYLQEFMPNKNTKYTLEASPSYYRNTATAIPRMKALLPGAYLIHVLREPSARLFAYYTGIKFRRNWLAPDVTFDQFVDVVVGESDPHVLQPDDPNRAQNIYDARMVGFYDEILAAFQATFPSDRMTVQFNEQLAKDPKSVLSNICRLLDIDPQFYSDFQFTRENQSIFPQSLGFYRAALKLNALAEPLLNRLPQLRRTLRSAHNRFNGHGAPQLHASNTALAKLKTFYEPHNRALCEMLRKDDPNRELPEWVTGYRR